jgi:GIY-YIG catalytic domain/NUMOD3 motif
MPRKQKKYHYIYKTTNLINGKYYIGMHSTDNLEDGYIGSGKRLWYSIKKYGKENFKCDVIEMLPNRSSLKEKEKELVNEDLLKDSNCLNLMCGGEGGFISDEQQRWRSICAAKKSLEKLRTDNEWRIRHSKIASENLIKAHRSGKIKYDTFTGKKHSEETKRKIGEINSIKQSGSSNSQFGSQWITNGEQNKKIKMMGIVPTGWKLGRTPKK